MSENWIKNKEIVSDKDIAAAEKAEKVERKKIKNGWRWVKIISSLKILVPHDKKGNPRQKAKR